jgi:two-component system cell cycle sensor histidine kinase/response regulator CckA
MRQQAFPDILPQNAHHRLSSLLSNVSPELLWQLSLEQLDVAIGIKHANGEVIYANQRFCDLIECSKEDIIGKKVEDVLPQKNYDQQKALLEKEREKRLSGKAGVYDLELEVASGRTKTVRVHASPIFDCDKNYLGSIAILTDISRETTALKAVSNAEVLLAAVFNVASVGLCITDSEGKVIAANPAHSRINGYTQEELVGELFTKVLPPELREDALKLHREYMEGTLNDMSGEWQVLHKNGTRRDVAVSVARLILDDGRKFRVTAVTDITEHKLIERQLRYQAQLLENVSDAVMAVDNDYIITSWNTAAEKLYGWTAAEVLGKHIYHILPHRYLSDVNDEIVSEVMRTAGKWVGEVIQKRKDGTEVITEACVSQIHNEKDEVIGLVSINRDITEQKRYAEERQRLYEQLQHLQKMESIGRLAGGIAHDFNNILAAILGNVKMATEKTSDEKVLKYLSRIKAVSERASALTQQLLGFARQGKYEVTAVDLRDCVCNVVEMLEHTIDKRIEVVVEPAHMSTKVMGDRTQLEQVILNLAVNAIDAMMPTLEAKQSGILRFSWGSGVREEIKTINTHLLPNQPYLCLAVSDSGIGIPKDIQKTIFEPFFTTKEIGKGTGLGLAMVYGIMQNHHGTVHVESEVGKGTTFELYFPELLESQTENGVTGTYINQKLMNNKRVLIVDDEDMLRELLTEQLTEAGYAVCEACNGAEAIEVLKRLQAEQVRVDAVVLDMNMPKMDGARAFAEIRALFPRMPILIATGYAEDEMVQKVVESGANGVLVKPYDAEALFEKLSEILKMRA